MNLNQGNRRISREQRLKQTTPTLEESFQRYLEEITPKKRGTTTSDASLVKVWCKTSLRTRPLAFISRQDLINLRNEWLEKYAAATVVRRLALISHLFTIAIKEWGMVYLNDPTKLLRKPIVENARDRRIINTISVDDYPEDEVSWIMRNTKSKTLPTIICLAVETAMRRSEIINIKREDIYFEDGFIFIPKSKNGNKRKVPLSPWAKFILIEYLIKNNKRGQIFQVSEGAVTRSFIRATQKARQQYEMVCQEKGIFPREDCFVDLRFHDLRHEATSRLAEIYEMHELAKITGHADTRMLLRYYHPSIEHLSNKLANSKMGQQQFNKINRELLKRI